MASSCISSCVNDTRAPVRATYVNLYKWPESDAEFIRSMSSSNMRKNGGSSSSSSSCHPRPRVVDSISCRQLYLRSYTFSREEDNMEEENTKCLGRVKSKVDNTRRKRHGGGGSGGGSHGPGGRRRRRKCGRLRRVKEASCAAFVSIFQRLLFCTTKVDVVD